MNFLALFLGLLIERLLTQVFHWREFHWLDPVFDQAFRPARASGWFAGLAVSLGAAFLVVFPVLLVELALQDRLAQIPLFVFAVVVMLFCLGPRDLGEEVDEFQAAVASGDKDEIRQRAAEFLQVVPDTDAPPDIEAAIYAQANNRIFAVVFWFALLGPAAAWFFRVLDLMRRRAISCLAEYQSGDPEVQPPPAVQAVFWLHRLAAWIPARLLMIGYTLAGSYDGATAAWRQPLPPEPGVAPGPGPDDRRLGLVGCGAAPETAADDVSTRANVALKLVVRVLWMIWCPALALLTLYGWIN